MSKFIRKLLLALFSILLFLAICELAVRKIAPQITYSAAVANSIDCYEKDPAIPFTLAKNRKCKMVNINGEFKTSATINSLGYRGKEFTLEKPAGKTRVLVVGDSMTFGWGVGDNQTYPYLLENILKEKGVSNAEVINGGYVGGLSPDSYYVYLKNQGLGLKPDILILGFFVWNDISDLDGNIWQKENSLGLPEKVSFCCYAVDGHILRNKVISFKYRFPILRESHLFILLVNTLQRRFNLFPEQSLRSHRGEELMGCPLNPDCIHLFSPEEEKTLKIIKEIKAMADKQSVRLLVALLPVDMQLYPQAAEKYSRYNIKWYPKPGEETFLQKRLGKYFVQNDINYLDLYQYFNSQRSRGYPFFPIDAHFNSIGTQLTAEDVANYLLENKWVK